jgi:hypothetical protein
VQGKIDSLETEINKLKDDRDKRLGSLQNAQEQERINEAEPLPWDKNKGKMSGDKNAQNLGAGLVKGILQEMGLPDVFGKPITEWGIWKLAMNGLGYGAGLLQNMTRLGGPISGGSSTGSVPLGLGEGVLGQSLPGIASLIKPGVVPGGINPADPASSTSAMTPTPDGGIQHLTGATPGPGTNITINGTNEISRDNVLGAVNHPAASHIVPPVAPPAAAVHKS